MKWFCCPNCNACFVDMAQYEEHIMAYHSKSRSKSSRLVEATVRSQYDSVERLRLLLKDGYFIHRISHPHTTNGIKSTMVELMKGMGVCMITTFGEEADALSEFVGTPAPMD